MKLFYHVVTVRWGRGQACVELAKMDDGGTSPSIMEGDVIRGMPPVPATPITQLAQGLLGIMLALLRMARWALHFLSITVPSAVYRILHYSMTVKVTFPVLVLWCVCVTSLVILWLRYRHWNRYEYVREAPIRKIHPADLPSEEAPETHDYDDRASFNSYLDEFLQAIRVFGFLERPVFHELTRYLQTRRLLAGDEIELSAETSFYIVIEGHVQVFAHIPHSDAVPEYQLVNEVRRGGTLSSLFTILRLFTEHVEQDDTDVPPLSSCHADTGEVLGAPSESRPFSQSGTRARATQDTTLAAIPAEGFRHLTAKYPSAASHIVQVILTRLSRVTFLTAHQYLGLTYYVMQTERAINESARAFLPDKYYEPAALEQLCRRFYPLSRPSVADLRPRASAPHLEWPLPHVYQAVGPGDLHSMVGVLDEPLVSDVPVRYTSDESLTGHIPRDALDLRDEVMHCIVQSVGLTEAIIPDVPVPLASPFLSSQRGPLAAYTNLSRLDVPTLSSSAPPVADDASATSALPAEESGVELRLFHAGSVLARAGQTDAGLFYVIDGVLDMRIAQTEEHAAQCLFSVERGGIAGYLSSLLGVPSFVDIVARTDTYVGLLPVKALERWVERRPNALFTLSKRLLSLLPPLILHIDASLDWVHVGAGQVLYREGDVGDSLYVVISGRLRALQEQGGAAREVVGEYSQGDSVGEVEVITRSPRTVTMHSIRDSELARMPMTLFHALALWHPPITIQISRILARRMRTDMDMRETARRMALPPHLATTIGRGQSTHNFKTVAVLPTSSDVPIAAFTQQLQAACTTVLAEPVVVLRQSTVIRELGRHAFSRMGKLKLAGWLADQEQHYRLVLYMVDTPASSSWAATAVRQADCILLVGLGDDPHAGELERLLLTIKTTARKELVLLHSERSVSPGTTREWLKPRPWVSAHHHVEMPGIKAPRMRVMRDPTPVEAIRTWTQQLKTRIARTSHAPQPRGTRPAHLSDMARLARRLCGHSIGLVLGGGGARGCAHIGVLRALEELGIPIDLVGGTSIGSFVGGLYARDGAAVSSHGRAKRFAGRMASLWRFVTDLTYPLVSYTTGHEFNRGIFKCFSDTHIEDMWLPYFCNTTNITWSRMEVHLSGYAWRYIRASMTLAGLVPPMIDDGDMLVDGGYTDNLPVSIMLAMGARTVIAIDVSSIDDTTSQSYGDTLSGWWVLLNRFNPFSNMRMIPSIPDIQTRLTYTTSVKMLESAKANEACLYLRMPVEQYGTLEFGRYTEILMAGYNVAIQALAKWQADGRLPTHARGFPTATKSAERGLRARRNSI